MIVGMPALATAARAMNFYSRQVDRAAADIARAGLPVAEAPTEGASAPADPAAEAVDLAGAEVQMLIAQRAFMAQLRTMRTADEMMSEAIRLGDTSRG